MGRLLRLAAWVAALLTALWVGIGLVGYPLPPPRPTDWHATAYRVEHGHQHLIHLEGDAYGIGHENSRLLAPYMRQQEEKLVDMLIGFARTPFRALLIQQLSLLYLAGLDNYLLPRERLEILGLADGGPDPMPDLGERYGRIAGYHAIHELSHRFAFDNPIFACSMVAVGAPHGEAGHAYLARNFDFEAGEAFDLDKVVLAVKPQGGYGFISVSWAGMAGVVSGINEHGLAIVLNAGASSGYRRVGTPTTLLIRRALEEARTIDEALPILTGGKPFISDILGLADRTGRVAVLELTPHRYGLREGSLLVATNHMETEGLAEDPVNLERAAQTTTLPRRARLEAIVRQHGNAPYGVDDLLAILRDRSDSEGHLLPLAHRHAIDAMIATHSVIFDATGGRIWVSEGPHTLGPYYGYDVGALLAAESPSAARGAYLPSLPPDPMLATYPSIVAGRAAIAGAQAAIKAGDLATAEHDARRIPVALGDHPSTLMLRGEIAELKGDATWAERFYTEALRSPPEYAPETHAIEAALERLHDAAPH